jgi:hypothetical protein
MPELEIHAEGEHPTDSLGQRVGVLAALLAVALAVVSIESHRTHTAAIIHKSAANDAWAHYQSTRVKYHNLELGENLLDVLGAKNAAADKMAADYTAQLKKYGDQSAEIQKEAQGDDNMAEADENRGLRYDIGEGLLEISVVVCSLYFISRKKLFPVVALAAGCGGIAVAITGMLVGG